MRILPVVVAVVLGACSTTPSGTDDTSPDPGTAGPMAAALRQVATEDNTFGGQPVFSELLVLDHLDPTAGGGGTGGEAEPPPGSGEPDETPDRDAGRDLTDEERVAIEEALSPVATVTWIVDPDGWRTADLQPVSAGSAILGVGEVTWEGDTAIVPVSLWCGGLCGTWLTYTVERIDGAWAVTGIVGPIVIS